MIHFNPDYAQQIGAYHFCCLWLISWGVLVIAGFIETIVEKILKKRKGDNNDTN